ncbi:hypothetical protein PPYR_03010 [Photinus pyralis]|uniref:Fatty acyl-CoA reductase n=1 Tax=Photinus pyralis TaxID=7054 RepID=A0A5N4A1K6_PHOPY|nr:fatty acyl-CoA reductase wat-like [Photinus pyralis]KAB0791210.1 hypothetical protein PPYR_03010 [Photinus pyralis]
MEEATPIQKFYSGQTVFVTGGTGFVGKVLIEKLLRTCYDLRKIYMLVRPKKGQTCEKRMEEFFNNSLYDRLKIEQPASTGKLCMIPGDCELPDLGLTADDRELLRSEVNCVFHVAATVRFDEKLYKATYINVRATRDLIRLAKEMLELRSFVHISTAYSFCVNSTIDEKIGEVPITAENLIKFVETTGEKRVVAATPDVIKPWPNTYALTKAVAEKLLETSGAGLPIAVVRPSIILATANEPVSGWIDNFYGPTAVFLGVAMGIIRTVQCDENCVVDAVPADYLANTVISAAWMASGGHPDGSIPVFNFVSSRESPITWKASYETALRYARLIPSMKALWYGFIKTTPSPIVFNILHFLLHILPACLIDVFLSLTGEKPYLLNIYKKIKENIHTLSYFTIRQWNFVNTNTRTLWMSLSDEDKSLFQFNMNSFSWNSYIYSYVYGTRLYLLKEKVETLPQARKRLFRLKVIHYLVVVILLYFVYKCVSFALNLLF